MAAVDLGHLDRHRTVDVHRERRHLPRLLQAVQDPQQLLRPVHGERRHQDHAALVGRVAHDARQVVLGAGWVRSVAVRGLEEQHVGRGDGRGIGEDGTVVAPEVAREHEPRSLEVELDRRRAENVTRLAQQRRHPVRHGERRVVIAGPDQSERCLRVGRCVERQRGRMLRVAAAVRPVGVVLLQPRGVGEHDAEQIRGAGGAIDRPVKALACEQRQVPGVIDVGVAQHHGVHVPRVRESLVPVAQPQRFQSLEQPAVEQHTALAGGDQVHGTRHRPRSAEKLEGRHGGRSCNRRRYTASTFDSSRKQPFRPREDTTFRRRSTPRSREVMLPLCS